jgi:3-hydroxy-9,10-secoandrosta-1,3,5(10)-triene-9,17-dione monooxygenase
MLAVTVRDGERVVDHRMCLLHKSQYEVVDDWHVMGMRATGSMTVVAKDVFVPEYQALCMYEARGGDRFPGARTNPHPVYAVPLRAGRPRHRRVRSRQLRRRRWSTRSHRSRSAAPATPGMKMRDFQTVQAAHRRRRREDRHGGLILRNDCLEAQENRQPQRHRGRRRRSCASSATSRSRAASPPRP